MQRADLQKYKLPDSPGVYVFKHKKEVVYVGKATSLKDRVKSYFGKDLLVTRGAKVASMVLESTKLEWIETDSVLEALILEANLIKKYTPVGNTRDKDNKSFNYVVVTEEDFPRILIARGRELFAGKVKLGKDMYGMADMRHVFGPYPDGAALREALKLVRRIFPFRDFCDPNVRGRTPTKYGGSTSVPRSCFNKQIHLCPGVCDGSISKKEYAVLVRNITYFFMGKKRELVRKLEKEMREASTREDFEQARSIQRQIKALQHIRDVALIKRDAKELGDTDMESSGGEFRSKFRIEAYDVAHISGTHTVGVMVASEEENGKMVIQKSALRKFIIRESKNDDIASLTELLTRRLRHAEWQYPSLIVIDGGETHLQAARAVLSKLNLQIPSVAVVKDDRHKAKGIIGDEKLIEKYRLDILALNAEVHTQAVKFHRTRRDRLV